jgi:hypothetical protein
MDIELLKKILKDDNLHVGLGVIKRLHIAEDRSYLKVTLSVLPEEREIVATMTWESVGADSGDFDFPDTNDLVLFAQADLGDDENMEEYAFVVKRLTSSDDTIPEEALTGDKVHKAKVGKKYWNISDTAIYLSKDGTAPTENLVLGQVWKTTYSTHIDEITNALSKIEDQIQKEAEHTHIVIGIPTSAPTNSAAMLAIKAQIATIRQNLIDLKEDKVTNEAILSDLAFTEKGN